MLKLAQLLFEAIIARSSLAVFGDIETMPHRHSLEGFDLWIPRVLAEWPYFLAGFIGRKLS